MLLRNVSIKNLYVQCILSASNMQIKFLCEFLEEGDLVTYETYMYILYVPYFTFPLNL